MKINEIAILVIVLISIFGSCNKQTKPQKISEKKFVQIYCDVASFSDIIESKSRKAFVDSVFEYYQVTPENYNYTKNSFSNDPEKWRKIFEKIVEELEKRKAEFDIKTEPQVEEKSTIKKN